ncbi:40S ribosomal protein S30 [Cinnamomum micranthum f. kanehirae]|uniref:40S ribosomal protein S30 n=1 Tax=Cinnamomum micranthum f. kanehirae TaxID=337451 RepID=A0A443N227_9MAGN|nr:40S ribosomal protein S30 [Cinnamomum micranthum f. kanehirae]
MGKVHGSLARAGKVRGQTPKVAKQDKKKKPRGRAHKRMQYNRRFVTAVVGFGKKRGPNSSENSDVLGQLDNTVGAVVFVLLIFQVLFSLGI